MSTEPRKPRLFDRPLNIRTALTTPPPPLDPVLPGLLAGTFGICAAAGGTGKTTFLLQLCFSLASGGRLCGGLFDDLVDAASQRKPCRVVMVCAEESADIVQNRLHAIADFVLSGNDSPDLFDANQVLDALERNFILFPLQGIANAALLNADLEPTETYSQLLEACKGARLVVLDPLRKLHRGDENSSLAMEAVGQLLQHLATQTGAAVIAAHHTNRASANDGTSDSALASRGSTALTDGARWQLNLSRPSPELLKRYGIAVDEEAQFRYVRLTLPKLNYLTPQPPRLLCRSARGALALVTSASKPTRGVRSAASAAVGRRSAHRPSTNEAGQGGRA